MSRVTFHASSTQLTYTHAFFPHERENIAQVGRESGNSLQAFLSIVRAEGVKGLFVGGKEQLLREIPFNAVQFTVYEVGSRLMRRQITCMLVHSRHVKSLLLYNRRLSLGCPAKKPSMVRFFGFESACSCRMP